VKKTSLDDLIQVIDWTLSLAVESDISKSDAVAGKEQQQLGKHIVFSLNDLLLAIPMKFVVEAGELGLVCPLPRLPEWLAGIMNLRGEIVSVINLGVFLNVAKFGGQLGQAYLLLDNGVFKTAIAVERIMGIRFLIKLNEEKNGGAKEKGRLSWFSEEVASAPGDFSQAQQINIFNVEKFMNCPGMIALLDTIPIV